MYRNNTLNYQKFPIFKEAIFFQAKDTTVAHKDRDFKFFISAEYNFETYTWNSGYFSIQNSQWKDSNTTTYRFPILGLGLTPSWIIGENSNHRKFSFVSPA